MRVRSADKHLWQDAEKACQLLKRATGAIRSSKFWVRSSENLELRTSNFGPRTSDLEPRSSRLSRQSRVSRAASLREYSPVVPHVRTIEVLTCQHCFPQPASSSCLSPSNIGEPTAIHRFSVLTQTKRVLNPLVFFSPPTSCVPLVSCRIVLKPAKGLLRRSHPQHPPAKTCRC
jgi:hypothetical protein